MRERTAKACGPGALVAGANPWGHEPRGDGDTKAGLAGARTIYAVSTIAQGMSMFRLHLWRLHSCAFYQCTRGCGCRETPGIPCALPFLEDARLAELGHCVPREGGVMCTQIVIASEAKQSRVWPAILDCFVAFAPRNDRELDRLPAKG